MARTPRLTPRILRVLSDCFNAAEAGGFSGDTEGLDPDDIDATDRWLTAWIGKFSKQLKKLDAEARARDEEEE